jgi:secondary thiamine-phosphate synthase enzyme
MTMRTFSIELAPRPRGVHLVTREILLGVDTQGTAVGLLHLFLQHTSAALTLNENASPEVRDDFERWFRRAVPDGADYFRHRLEGDDDMPAHIKASLMGAGLTVPVVDGRPALGTWQGIYLCEFRQRGGPRRLVATLVS